MNTALLVLTTYPDEKGAKELAASLVKNGLAACVNVLPKMNSFYQWNDQPCSGEEHLVIIKTIDNLYPRLESTILERHPYELPEIIATPITRGLPGYINWIESNTHP